MGNVVSLHCFKEAVKVRTERPVAAEFPDSGSCTEIESCPHQAVQHRGNLIVGKALFVGALEKRPPEYSGPQNLLLQKGGDLGRTLHGSS